MLELQNISKMYKGKIALKDISFSLNKGEIVGILGSNGAGKSTLMNIITGYISMSSGDVLIDGQNILDEPDRVKEKIGFLPDAPPVYEEMTVDEYLHFVAKIKRITKNEIKQEISDKLEKLNLVHVRKRLIKNLSKGYKQRVGLAQAILGNPPLIVLDEPTVGLDPKELLSVRQIIKDLSETSLVMISSHILSEINSVCTNIIVIDEGEMITSGFTNLQSSDQDEASHQLSLKVKGEDVAIRAILERIDEITSIELQPESEKECCDYSILYNKENDIREQVFRELANHALPILEMSVKEKTLEEHFMRLILKKKGVYE